MTLPATDNFNRANESPIAGNWSNYGSANRIVSNVATGPTSDADTFSKWNADTFNNNQYSKYTIPSTAGNMDAGPAVRIGTSGLNGYFVATYSAGAAYTKFVSGTYTSITSISTTFTTNDTVEIRVTGTGSGNITGFKNSVAISPASATDSSLTSGGAGFFIYNSSAQVDNWEGGNVGGATNFTSSVSGALSFSSGAILKKPSKLTSGALSFALGTLLKRSSKLISGVLSFSSGTLLGLKIAIKNITGTLSFTSGQILKNNNKSLLAILGLSGTTTKQNNKSISGVLSFSSGILVAIKSVLKAIAGTLSFASGVLNRRTSKLVLGSVSFTGSILKTPSRLLVATLNFVGTTSKTTIKFVSGILSFVGSLGTQLSNHLIFKAIDGTLSFASGSIVKRVDKVTSGVLSFVGSLSKQPRRLIAATLSFSSGTLSSLKAFFKTITGILSFSSGVLVGRANKSLAGILSFSGLIAKSIQKKVAGTLSLIGSFAGSRTFIKAITGALSFTSGVVKKSILKLNTGILNISSNINRSISKGISGVLTFIGYTTKTTNKKVQGILSFLNGILQTYLPSLFHPSVDRTYAIIAENRLYTVSLESRSYTIPLENRVHIL